MQITELSIAQLNKAIALKEQIAQLEGELAGLLGTPAKPAVASASAPVQAKKKGGMSAAGRAAVAAAQKRRWAKIKGLSKAAPTAVKPVVAKPAAKATAPKPAKKWKLSAAGLAKIKAANKAYWAKKKAGK